MLPSDATRSRLMKMDFQFGDRTVPLQAPAGKRVAVRQSMAAGGVADAAQMLRAALNAPTGFPSLRLALTPDDHIAIVLDPGLPQLDGLLSVLIEHVGEAGVPPEHLSLVVAAEPKSAPWRDRLGPWEARLTIEVHDPHDRDKLSYLAATQKGRRIYINRTVVDADQVVVLSRAGYDWAQGYVGTTKAIFPALSDEATRKEFDSLTESLLQGETAQAFLGESEEAIWLLGAPFFIQVIEGLGDDIAEIVAGAGESLIEGRSRLDAAWAISDKREASLIVAEVTGSPARLELRDLAGAAAKAAQFAEPDGVVALVYPGGIELDDAMKVVSGAGDPMDAARQLHRQKPQSPGPALQWLWAIGRTRVYLLSGAAGETVEDIFATPLEKPDQIQRLVDSASSVMFLRDPHKLVVGPARIPNEQPQRRAKKSREDRARR
jgi:nickel-dependent lactate racemase